MLDFNRTFQLLIMLIASGCTPAQHLKHSNLDASVADAAVTRSQRAIELPRIEREYVAATSCTPCAADLGTSGPSLKIRLQSTGSDALLAVEVGTHPTVNSTLKVNSADSQPVSEWQLALEDVNFDGYRDLYLMVSRGVVNEYAQYWLYAPSLRAFVDIGRYPVFDVDPSGKRLTTFERNGSAGLEYEKREYRVVDDRPVLWRRERQIPGEAFGTFRKTVEARSGETLKMLEETVVRVNPDVRAE